MDVSRQENESLEEWFARIDFRQCMGCYISEEYSTKQPVFTRGAFDAPVVIVGEAPGAEEELKGEVFVGPAGKKLEEFLKAVGLESSQFYITNTVKCRPIGNRAPTPGECRACREKFLKHEIAAYPRELILTLGNVGYFGVVPKGVPAGIMARNGLFEYCEEFNSMVLPCIHPAAVLRNPSNTTLMEDVISKLKKFIDDGYQLPMSQSGTYSHIRDLSKLEEFLQEVKQRKRFAVDLETEGFSFMYDRILCMVFSTHAFSAWYLPIIEGGELVWCKDDWKIIQESLRQIFEDPEIGKIGHNLKFDLKFLIHNFGYDIKGDMDDTMLMHHLLDENTEHGLKPLAARFTDMGYYSRELEAAFTAIKRSRIPPEEKHYGKIESQVLWEYALRDADATFRLYDQFGEQLSHKPKLIRLYQRNVMEVMRVLLKMEMVGIRIDLPLLEEYKHTFRERLNELEAAVASHSSKPLNIRSVQQLSDFLYNDLGLPVITVSEKGLPSTDGATLNALKTLTSHPVLDLLLEFREIGKLYSTYVIGLEDLIDHCGRVHTSFLQHGTVTGRLASREPNLQNIPRPDVTGKLPSIRHLFIPEEDWFLIQSDYGQMELRAWAQYTQEEQFIQALRSGDVHSYIGSILLGKPADQIDKEERTKVKTIVFGLIYGRGAPSVAESLKISIEEAQTFIDMFFQMFPQSSNWLRVQEERVKRDKKITSLFGRERHLPGVTSSDSGIRAQALRQGRNCIREGTLVSTSKGLVPIEVLCTGEELALEATGMFSKSTVLRGVYSGKQECLRVTLDDGRYLDVTREHLVYYLDDTGSISCKPVSEFRIGEYLVSPLNKYCAADVTFGWEFYKLQPPWGLVEGVKIPAHMSPELAELLGILVGDGHMGYSSEGFAVSISYKDPDYMPFVKDLIKRIFDVEPVVKPVPYRGFTSYLLKVESGTVKRFIAYAGLVEGAAHKSEVVPQAVLQSSARAQAAFLRGLFDTDGTFSSAGLSLSCYHETLARQVQYMLLGLGIPSGLVHAKNGWILHVRTKEGKQTFIKKIGSSRASKRLKLVEIEKRARAANGHLKSVPVPLLQRLRRLASKDILKGYYRNVMCFGVSVSRAEEVYLPLLQAAGVEADDFKQLLSLQYNRIASIAPIGEYNTYDLCIREDPPAFSVNGVLCHNSPIQALASDITNMALVRISKNFERFHMKSRALIQIHDCIIVESPSDEVKNAYAIVEDSMLEQPAKFTVPLVVDIQAVERWDGEKVDLDNLPGGK